MPNVKNILLLALAGAALMAAPARAQLTLAAPSFAVGDAELRLGGDAGGAVFSPDQPGWNGAQASGVARLMPKLQRDYDSGLALALNGTFAASDLLSRGRYDGDVVEKFYGEARTGLGRLEVGLTDGAGYDLAVTGPKVDAAVSLDDPRTSFFRDPVTHRAVTDMFALRTEVGASSNYAKFVYASPALFGVQLALSFTPSEGKQLPFMNAGPQVADRQVNIMEAALRYSDDFGPVTLSAYGAIAEGRGEHKLAGQEGVSDMGIGLRADYPVNDEISVSLGGSWRQSNANGFDINRSYDGATTRAMHLSGAVTDDAWTAGFEFGNGVAGAVPGRPRMGLNGAQASLGYKVSSSMDVSGGWQRLSYARGSGTFFNGTPQLKMDAVYLHLNLHTSN